MPMVAISMVSLLADKIVRPGDKRRTIPVVEIPPLLRDFQTEGESPAFGLFHAVAFSTAPFTHRFCYRARNASGVVFTPEGSRRVLVCKRTRHEAARGTLHHRSSHAGGGVSGGPYAQATAGGRSAGMWQDRARIRRSRSGQYGG